MKAILLALFAGTLACASVQPVLAADGGSFKEQVLWSFGSGADGRLPYANLIEVSGTLYGTTARSAGTDCGGFGCGTVFSLDPKTGTETVLYSFCSRRNCRDGANPQAGLIDVNGTLYGTTGLGGRNSSCHDSYGCGAVFALDPNTGAEKVLHSFCTYPICADGSLPIASLVAMKGMLYGTTQEGGTGCRGLGGCGTVFVLDPRNRGEKVLHSFDDDALPFAGLTAAKGILYGTTVGSGRSGCDSFTSTCGTVFSIDPGTGSEMLLYSFCSRRNCKDGANPTAGLIAVKDKLYGTTYAGGAKGGTVYSLDPGTGAETVVYAFCQKGHCSDGAHPWAGVIDVKGTLYGTTNEGGGTGCGGSGCGTVFSLDPATGAETVLHSFCSQKNCMDGATPFDSLIAVNDELYGTTQSGGAYGYGTVFVLRKKAPGDADPL